MNESGRGCDDLSTHRRTKHGSEAGGFKIGDTGESGDYSPADICGTGVTVLILSDVRKYGTDWTWLRRLVKSEVKRSVRETFERRKLGKKKGVRNNMDKHSDLKLRTNLCREFVDS